MSTAVNFMGLNLKNPIIVAAGPWSKDAASIQKSINAGAAAVTTETITLEKSQLLRPRIYKKGHGLFNTTLYSTLSFEELENEMSQIQKKDSFLICNIRGTTPSELAYTATAMERLGADALEICCFTPIGTKMENLAIHPDEIFEMIYQAVIKVNIPVMVRLPYHAAASHEFVRAVENAGAKAISAIETMSGLIGVDIERGCSMMPTIGGYSGPNIRPISLAATATLSQLANCQIASMGGIENATHVLEYLMLGASVVQIGSAIMTGGYGQITSTIESLCSWISAHQYTNIDEIRGIALNSLTPFEEIIPRPLNISMTAPCYKQCSIPLPCVTGCLDGAIIQEENDVKIIKNNCTGCGLCVSTCPQKYFSLKK